MVFEIIRPKAKQYPMLMNIALMAAAGVWFIYAEMQMPAASWLWVALGGLFLVWAAWLGYNLTQGLVLRLDESGVVARGIVATHRFGWDDLLWVDFTRPHAAALMMYKGSNGKDAVAVLTQKAANDDQRTEALRIIQSHRPDLPLASPKPHVSLKGTA